jgi:hypothetical protein
MDIYFAHSFAMHRGVGFYKIIGQILISWSPVNAGLVLFESIFDPVKLHIHGSCTFLIDGVITAACSMLLALLLSVCNGMDGCGCLISSNIVRRTVASFACRNMDPISSAAAEDMPCLILVFMMRISPLVSPFVLYL